MSKAATQLHEWIDENFPGTRVGRQACRNTAGGKVSQHSAFDYGEYDSNALDIMGAEAGSTWAENVVRIWEIVDAIKDQHHEWSIRAVLWQMPDHFGHAHIDFLPMCLEHKWCGRDIEPAFRYTDGRGTVYTKDPDPQNGEYRGEEAMLTHFKVGSEYAEWEPVVWWLYMLEGGDIDANQNSDQVQLKLPWKDNVRLVQVEDFDLLTEKIQLSNANRIKMEDEGLYRFGKELAELRQLAYA